MARLLWGVFVIVAITGCRQIFGIDPPSRALDAAVDAADADADAALPVLRQKTITIGPVLFATLVDFPLWVKLTDPDLAAHARPDGTDIHFVDDASQPLDYEIQQWSSSSGQLEAWVRVPSMTAGTRIAIRYGDVAVAHAPDPAATFSSYAAVWHFEDSLATTTVADATGKDDGTAVSLAPGDSVDAQLGRGINFAGDDAKEITIANPLSGTTSHTISVWIDQKTTATNDAIVALGDGSQDHARWFHSHYVNPTIAVGFFANDFMDPGVDIEGGGWVLLHWVYVGSTRRSFLYENGALVAGPYTHSTGIDTQGMEGYIGNAPSSFGANMGIDATLDELRITDVARGAAWIGTEAKNQSAPDSFYTVGAEQTL